MASDKTNSFELYGFDILLNSKLEPSLIEVNGSPSMTANTEKDRQFKLALLDDTLSVVDLENFLLGSEEQIGGFDLICKGKSGKSKEGRVCMGRRSLLGTLNNREELMKKYAKNYAARLN